MYVKDDPRSALQTDDPEQDKRVHEDYFGSQFGLFYETEPQIETETERTWITRGQNFIVAYTECVEGTVLRRSGQPDEYGVILPDAHNDVSAVAGGETKEVSGFSVTFVPPGDSELAMKLAGRIVRIFSPNTADLAALASNAEAFAGEHPNVPPFQPWSAPPDGFKIRSYSLDVPQETDRFGRIFRSTNLMINFLYPRNGPRDRTAVSPHHHDDFEQCSLALDGSFTHHLRWPWTTNMMKWKDDEHHLCASPSVFVIPPPSIHTTTAESDGLNQLVDIFAPPRRDFSAKPGWVLNAEDYPVEEN